MNMKLKILFQTWKLKHGKLYEGAEEEVARLRIWMETKTRVERHNQDYLKVSTIMKQKK